MRVRVRAYVYFDFRSNFAASPFIKLFCAVIMATGNATSMTQAIGPRRDLGCGPTSHPTVPRLRPPRILPSNCAHPNAFSGGLRDAACQLLVADQSLAQGGSLPIVERVPTLVGGQLYLNVCGREAQGRENEDRTSCSCFRAFSSMHRKS